MNDKRSRPETGTGNGGDSAAGGRTERPLPTYLMFALAIMVGVVGGVGSVVFKATIAFFHNLFFYGEFGLTYDPTAHIAPSPLGILIILVPVVGAVLVTWITETVAPEARGHGVPEVLNAIYYQKGHIRPVVVLAKALASAISIGTGGSVGREGPIIQIGSAFGSMMGQIIHMPVRQRVVLVCAGAGAGIAATFNAPVGGLAFAMELLLVSISARTVALVAIATVTATYVGRIYSGLAPSFDVPQIAHFQGHLLSIVTFVLCIPFGALIGVAAGGFTRGIYWMEDLFQNNIRNAYLRHMLGMFLVGIMLYAFLLQFDHYYVGGVGYSTIVDVLRDTLNDPMFLLLLFAAKLLATGLTLGSGASGGIFSPALFMGATLGCAFGNIFAVVFPEAHVEPVVFAVAGMAGMISGSTGAVVTAITMTLEQTRDFSAVLPIITTGAIAYVVRVRMTTESIYTLKLARRGATVPQGLQAAVSSAHNARTMMSKNFHIVDIKDLNDWQAGYRPGEGPRYTVISRDGEIVGLARAELIYLLRDKDPEAVIDKNYFLVASNTPWQVVMRGLRAKETDTALVTTDRKSRRSEDLVGIITSREIARQTRESAELIDY